ncbi:hypothetical protein ACHHYP_02046 [Achlya hypogyna]|uniref:Serine/threonine-protein phosphatase 4 regulatory subunit n=1 Tax=Achlya hypogyna TaxID=1202772 RepID=A0A1V9ZSN6_ACHHY|nr:hypothetical protein ACHHYP_02046 [Achlya hypogyna]
MDDFFFEKEAECCFDRDGDVNPSDLEKLEVPEDMAEIPRADWLLKTGLKQQKISVLASIPTILAGNNTKENLIVVLDDIKMVWKRNETENDMDILVEILNCLMHLAGDTVAGKLLSYPLPALHEEYDQLIAAYNREKQAAVFLLSEEQVTKQLLPMVLDFVNDIQQKDVAEVASRCIAAIVPRLSGSVKKTQARAIIRIGIEKGDVSQAAGSRLICCWVLGVLTASTLLSEQDIESLFFQKMMELCQDTDTEVRSCMCMQLDALARAVSMPKACADLLPELLELLQDEEEQVKIVAFRTLLSLYDYYPKRERDALIFPVLVDLVAHTPPYLCGPLATGFGRLVYKLFTLNDLSAESSSTFLSTFNRLGRSPEADTRLACACNFPAVVLSFGANQYSAQLDDLLQALTQDKVESVRIAAVSGLHEVAHLLGQQRALRYIKALSLTTLRDESAVVQGYMIARLPDVMSYFCASVDDDQRNAYLETILKHILLHHTVLAAGKWRDQLRVVSALEKLHAFLTPVQLFERIFPLLFEMMNAGARPVQLEAVRILVVLLRENKSPANRFNILVRLRKEYAQGKSYWQRSLFLDACAFAFANYSRHYVRHNFIEPALDLLEDHVPNVRIKAATLLVPWKTCLDVAVAADDKLLARIRAALDGPHEGDRDVLCVLADARDTWAATAGGADAEDLRRAAAEEAAGMQTDHEMFTSEAKWSEMLEYTLIVGKDGQVVRRARVKSIDIITKIRLHNKDMPNPRAGSTSTAAPARQLGKLDVKPGMKLPTTVALKPVAASSAVSLPTCAGIATHSGKSASAGLLARESKSATATTGSLKQITDPAKMVPPRGVAAKSPTTTTTPASVASTKARDKKDESTTLAKIPNIPVPTRPVAPAKRVQSPSSTKPAAMTTTTTVLSARSNPPSGAKVAPLGKR